MRIQITKRYKDNQGRTYKYKVRINNGEEEERESAFVIEHKKDVVNADFIERTGEFRAKDGEHIETITVETRLVKVTGFEQNSINSCAVKGENITIDYYGKEFIGVCRSIRKMAVLKRFQVDRSNHRSNNGANVHLFKMIEACGVTVEQFIGGYLSNIQPYALSRFQSTTQISKEDTWLLDNGYGIALLIKIKNYKGNNAMVISFHESNIGGRNLRRKVNYFDKKCAVIVDEVNEIATGHYSVNYTIQRGFIRYSKIKSTTEYYFKGVALVNYEDIKFVIDDLLKEIFSKLYLTYVNDETSLYVGHSLMEKIDSSDVSFMSLGNNIVNNMQLLIDLNSRSPERMVRLWLIELAQNILIEVPKENLDVVKEALIEKYRYGDEDYDNELYKYIVEKI